MQLFSSVKSSLHSLMTSHSKQKKLQPSQLGSKSIPKTLVQKCETKPKKSLEEIQKQEYIKLCKLEAEIIKKFNQREQLKNKIIESKKEVEEIGKQHVGNSQEDKISLERIVKQAEISAKYPLTLSRIVSVSEADFTNDPEQTSETGSPIKNSEKKETDLYHRQSTLASQSYRDTYTHEQLPASSIQTQFNE